MSTLLLICLIISFVFLIGTLALIMVPITRSEISLWHSLHLHQIRHWLTERRKVQEPLEHYRTVKIARHNLRWHLILTAVFIILIALPLVSVETWWRPAAPFLMIPGCAYFIGSLVQRQKIAIIIHRKNRLSRSPAVPR
jgi:hypothetical protein